MRALPGLRAPRGTNHRPDGNQCLPDVRNHRTAGNACFSNPGLAGNRCGHRRKTRILEETVVETVVKPQTCVETVLPSIQVKKELTLCHAKNGFHKSQRFYNGVHNGFLQNAGYTTVSTTVSSQAWV